MKISVILPATSDTKYLEAIYRHIQQFVPSQILVEIIQVQELDDRRLVKIAEKSYARLYLFENSRLPEQFEAGAFHATGELLYFILPGYFPPEDFASRIITAAKKHQSLGSHQSKWLINCCKKLNSIRFENFLIRLIPIRNLWIHRGLFSKSGGIRFNGRSRSLSQLMLHCRIQISTTLFS